MHNNEDFYTILGIDESATQEEIKKAYRKKAMELHPDHGGSNELMYQLNYAYEQLSNPLLRKSYDQSRGYYSRKHKEETNRDYSSYGNKKQTKEDYSHATFVSGIEAMDCFGKTSFISVGDHIYFPKKFINRFIVWRFESTEYYRARVQKVYSVKRNHFKQRTPLFVVEVESFTQIIFMDDFRSYWASQASYNKYETNSMYKVIAGWGVLLVSVILLLALNQNSAVSYENSLEQGSATDQNCIIKGNISRITGERIYHTPTQQYYDETEIDSANGERYFCSEQDAIDAGWRKSEL